MPAATPPSTRAEARPLGGGRSLLHETPDAYGQALRVADRLDEAGFDLWAGDLRSCLDAPSSTARQHHLVLELTRLMTMSDVGRVGLTPDITKILACLGAGVGDIDLPIQPLYTALRDLADHLEVHGAQRWLARLRTVLHDTERGQAARLARLAHVMELMTPEAPGIPLGTVDRVRAVAARLPRFHTTPHAAAYLGLAVQPPAPSRAG